jgi:hypothetical protein
MAVARRPKRHNPNAERLTFTPEIETCPLCDESLSSEGSVAHSAKNVQTLDGDFYVVAYSRRCLNAECDNLGKHYHAAGHLKVSLPYSTYGLDVVAFIGLQREREHKQFIEIERLLNERGVEINDVSVGRLYRLFLALLAGTWPKRRERLAEAAEKYGGLILKADGLRPDGDGPQLYVLWEVLSGTPVMGMLVDKADEPHLRAWLSDALDLIGGLSILATLSDGEKALKGALKAVWPNAPHQLCQEHFMDNLSAPVHEDDRALCQGLKEHLSPLPSVPDLKAEEAAGRMEHLVAQKGTPGKKGAWRPTLPA